MPHNTDATDSVTSTVATIRTHHDHRLRSQAIESLEECVEVIRQNPELEAEVVSALAEAIRDKNTGIRQEAAIAMRHFGSASELSKPLLVALQDQEPNVRRVAAKSLGVLKCQEAEVLMKLRQAMKDSVPGVRLEAATAFWTITGQTKETVPVICESLHTGDVMVRSSGCRVLERMGVKDDAVIDSLRKLLLDACRLVRIQAARALWKLAGITDEVLPVLAEAFRHGTGPDRAMIKSLLERMGEEGRVAIHLLESPLQNESTVRHAPLKK